VLVGVDLVGGYDGHAVGDGVPVRRFRAGDKSAGRMEWFCVFREVNG